MKIDVYEISDKNILFEFNTQMEMNSSMIRFQEHCDCVFHRNLFFALEEYKQWYMDSYGVWDYYNCILGMNIPSWSFYDFRAYSRIKRNFLDSKEEKILSYLEKTFSREEDYYVICIFKGQEKKLDALKHEIAHALYYSNTEYKKKVNKILNSVDLKDIESYLKIAGYHKDCYQDECHAFVLEGLDFILSKDHEIYNIEKLRKASEKLDKVYNRYAPKKMRKIETIEI